MMEQVTFHLQDFEGPLDLLLHLLQKNKVNIYDIPIALITAQYLEYLEEMKKMDMEVTSEFLVMAAQLILIKSKMLLPRSEKEEDEGDPRAELVDRLLEYAKYKDAVEFLEKAQNSSKFLYFKKPDPISLPKVRCDETLVIPLPKLLTAFSDVLERLERKAPVRREAFEKIVKRETVPVSARISYLFHRFRQVETLTFDSLFEEVASRAEAVSTFLAVLELMRSGNMTVTEEDGTLMCRLEGDENEYKADPSID